MRISEKEFENGVGGFGDEEKRKKIVVVLGKVGKGGIDGKEVSKESGIKWVWSSLVKLVENGEVERKKIGKKYYYRLKVVKK